VGVPPRHDEMIRGGLVGVLDTEAAHLSRCAGILGQYRGFSNRAIALIWCQVIPLIGWRDGRFRTGLLLLLVGLLGWLGIQTGQDADLGG
jgi:hypothetical protein